MNHWIDSNSKLQTMCEELSHTAKLAVDTEFIRTDTFYPKIALIQISDSEQCWLVDVLAIDDFAPLKALLERPDHRLIFHACAEDLEVLEYALDIRPTHIFDTQIAAGIVNIGYCMGYARLVDALFDVTLDKQETRSDWLARPLTQRQLDYAAVDVEHLHAMEVILVKALDDQQRHDWFTEETEGLFALVEGRKDARHYYLKLKGAWRLGVKSLTALNRLCDWRESVARSMNRPRSHVLKDSVLMELAKRLPEATEQLQGIEDWFPRSVQRHGDSVLKQIADSASDTPVSALPQPLPKLISLVMREMRDSLSKVAQDIEIPQEFLCNKKELEAILRSSMEGQCQWPTRLTQGWRDASVRPALQEVLNSTKAL